MEDITINELKDKLDKEEDFVLIDVREPYEHEAFNIGGELIPMGRFPAVISDLEEYRDKEVVVYCRSGNRSGVIKRALVNSGFTNVRNLLGGMLAWQDEFGG